MSPRRLRPTRLAALAGALLAAGAIAVLGVGYALAHPVPARIGPPPPALHATPVVIAGRIHAWFSPSAAHRGAVLLLPGVRANRLSMVDRARFLRDAGYSVLLIDFQGTGESPGDAITFGWRERLDVVAAVDFLRRTLPNEPVAIIGSSLGGAAALLATPPLRVDAMIIESVYPSIDKATANRLHRYLGAPGAMVEPLLLVQLKPRIGVGADLLRPIDHVGSVTCPLLVISGAKDRYTTADDTRALFAAARGPKELWLVDGAGHVDLCRFAGEAYRARVLAFMAGVTPSVREGPGSRGVAPPTAQAPRSRSGRAAMASTTAGVRGPRTASHHLTPQGSHPSAYSATVAPAAAESSP